MFWEQQKQMQEKKALYANTYTAELYEGNPLQCGEKEDG